MNWKKELENYELSSNWVKAIDLMQKTISIEPNDIEAYIRIIYLLHFLLLEVGNVEFEHVELSNLLKKYYNDSKDKFKEEAEYLFFIGKILYIAEWYFGLDDDLKKMENKLAFQMEKKAYEKEPHNILFEWAYRFSLGEIYSKSLAEKILHNEQSKLEWLKSKGLPGKYIMDGLEFTLNMSFVSNPNEQN